MLKRIRKQNAKTTHVQPQKRKSSITNSWNTQQCPNGLINEDETIQENLEFHNNSQSPFSNNAQEDPELNDSSNIEDIWNLGKGEELPEKFNEKNQCIDDGELEYFCGTIARNSDLSPLEYADWRKVPKDKKEMIWNVVQTKFKLGPSREKWIIQQVGKCLRTYKHTLYEENFHKYKSLAELKDNPPPRTDPKQWEKLVGQWYSEEWQRKMNGKLPSRTQLFIKYHKHKDGTPVSSEAATIIQKINEIQAENEANNVEFEDNAPIEGDILSQVLGPEKNGRVRGMGFGVSPRMLKKDNINVIQQLQEVNNENIQLKENFAILLEEDNQLKEQYVSLKNEVSELKEIIAQLTQVPNTQ
ncbi:uncharacterized protein LOC110657217 [Hevea brasiliensis]|uniref:uncharacterized protein LOC110657217 n=1 Tax=Hevea brasiliensis TaxID=3981 RepID=UPI0026003FD3|nr:uncharacterized protein LOC110657217 [Hevea brasiliensis]